MSEERTELIRGLRELADFLETKTDIPLPHLSGTFDIWAYSADQFGTLSRMVGGFRSKESLENFMVHRRMFGPLKLDINVSREEVCERVVTGKRTVPAIPEHEVEIVEWRCGTVMTAAD